MFNSKFKTLFLLFVLFLVSCSEEEPVPTRDPAPQASDNNSNARHADGAGTGDMNPGTIGSVGNALTWQGNGRWSSAFFGTPVWFFGPTPAQLQNGIQGTWETTCANYTPGQCYPDGFIVSGNGAGFTIMAPACATVTSSTVTMPNLVTTVTDVLKNGVIMYSVYAYRWETQSLNITSFSGGNCKLEASGKIIVNSDCKPIIVSPNSSIANLCGQTVSMPSDTY